MNRRKAIAAGGLSALLPLFAFSESSRADNTNPINIGMAGYSFAHYKGDLESVIKVMQQVGLQQMTLKDFQLPYQSTQEQAGLILGKLKNAGIQVYGLGVIYMENEEDVAKYFDYATRAGIGMIIGSPAEKILPAVEKKVKSTGIRIAIHNHGPEDKRYPDIDSIYDQIKNLDSRIGICLDVGHSFRCGHDPAQMLERFGDRVFDMHIKDVTEPVANGISTIPGRGKINLGSIFKAAVRIGYKGNCSLEYERPGDPANGISESIGYIKGLIKGLDLSN